MVGYKTTVDPTLPKPSSSAPSRQAMRLSWFSRGRQDKTTSVLSLPLSAGPTPEPTFYSLPTGSYLDMPSLDESRPRRRPRPQSTWDLAFEHIFEDATARRPHSVYMPHATAAMSSPAFAFYESPRQVQPVPVVAVERQVPIDSAPRRRSRRVGSPPEVQKRCSSLLSLSMLQTDVSMNTTPSLSSASSASGDASDEQWQEPPSKRRSGFWARASRNDLTIDMVKVHDGMGTRDSTSGVYTPTTFPGPSGPHPSHYPSSVYTPPGYNLPSVSWAREEAQPKSAGRIAGKFSSAVNKAQSAFTGWKRSARAIPEVATPLTPQTPVSAHDSYFAFTPTTSDNGHVVYSAGRYAETSPALANYKSFAAPAPVAKPAPSAGLGFPEFESMAKASKGVRRKAVPQMVKDEADLRAELEMIARAQVA